MQIILIFYWIRYSSVALVIYIFKSLTTSRSITLLFIQLIEVHITWSIDIILLRSKLFLCILPQHRLRVRPKKQRKRRRNSNWTTVKLRCLLPLHSVKLPEPNSRMTSCHSWRLNIVTLELPRRAKNQRNDIIRPCYIFVIYSVVFFFAINVEI